MSDQRTPLRREFEQWYTTHAFDYERNPIGSRECGLQWKAYQAAIEARESEKAREWWTVAEKMPTADETVLVWVYNAWEQAYYLKDYWLSSSDSSTIKGMSMSDIWRLMPEAPVIGEGKS